MNNVVEGESRGLPRTPLPLRCTGPNGGKRSQMAIDLEGGENLASKLVVKGYLVVELVFL